MPEAPVHEYRRPVGPHHDVGLPGHRLHVEPIAVPVPPQPPPHLQLRLRVLAADVRHTAMPLLGSHRVGHKYSLEQHLMFFRHAL